MRDASAKRDSDRQWVALTYYVGIPAFIAFISGWNRMLLGPDSDRAFALAFWFALQFMIWYGALGGTYLSYWALRRWRPPLWLNLLLGVIIGWLILVQPIGAFVSWGLEASGQTWDPIPPGFTWPFAVAILNGVVPGTIRGLAAKYIVDRGLEMPRFRYEETPASNQASASPSPSALGPPLLLRLPPAMRGAVLYLKAEDHYVEVRTDKGRHLIHSRLKDAVTQMAGTEGLQVHRSYWVTRDSIVSLDKDGHGYALHLVDGDTIPVGRTYLKDVRQALVAERA